MITLAIKAMGEATALVGRGGLVAGDFLEVMTSTVFASSSYQRYGGYIATDTYEPGFKLTLGLKDVNLAGPPRRRGESRCRQRRSSGTPWPRRSIRVGCKGLVCSREGHPPTRRSGIGSVARQQPLTTCILPDPCSDPDERDRWVCK